MADSAGMERYVVGLEDVVVGGAVNFGSLTVSDCGALGVRPLPFSAFSYVFNSFGECVMGDVTSSSSDVA